jgi:hypothetical protein
MFGDTMSVSDERIGRWRRRLFNEQITGHTLTAKRDYAAASSPNPTTTSRGLGRERTEFSKPVNWSWCD